MKITEPKLYRRYLGMITRCYNPHSHEYKHYGGRGIKICPSWLAHYEYFEKWALENGFSPELSIDRIDVNKGYSPDNCRWTDALTQARNKTTNLFYGGRSMTADEWAEELGISRGTIASRRAQGWPDARILHPELYPSALPPRGTTLLRCPRCGGDSVTLFFAEHHPSSPFGSGRCRDKSCQYIWPLDAEGYRLFATRPGVEGRNATNLSLLEVL